MDVDTRHKELEHLLSSSHGQLSYQSTDHSASIESETPSTDESFNPPVLTSVPVSHASLQSRRSQMVVSGRNTINANFEVSPEGQPLLTPAQQPDYLNAQTIGPAHRSDQVHVQCTDRGTVLPSQRPDSRVSINTSNHMVPQQEIVDHQRLNQKCVEGIKAQPKLFAVCLLCCVVLFFAIVGSIATAAYFGNSCTAYSTFKKINSGNTLLVSPNIDTSCHNSLFIQEVTDSIGFIDQEIQIFTGTCNDIHKRRDRIYSPRYGYTNLTGSFGIYDNGFFSINSNVSVAINASTPPNTASEVIVCLFNNQSSFTEFTTNQQKWREYIQYAVICNHTVVSTSEPTMMTVFTYNLETEGYYSLGLASYEIVSYLDEVVYGERFLYSKANLTQINCTLYTHSTPACHLPLSSSSTCWLLYAVPPVEVSKGFTGIQVTSNPVIALERTGLTIALPAVLAILFLLLFCVSSICLIKVCTARERE